MTYKTIKIIKKKFDFNQFIPYILYMIKNKTFTANIHAHSIGGEKILFFNTNTNTKIQMESTNHVLTFQAKDKHEVRRQVGKRVRELQSHLTFGEDYTFYINQIWEK